MDLLYHADLQYNIMQWTDEEKGAKPSALTRGWGRPGRMQHLQLHTLQIFLCRHWFLHVCTHCTIQLPFHVRVGVWEMEATLHICCVMISPIHMLPSNQGAFAAYDWWGGSIIKPTKYLSHKKVDTLYIHTLKRVSCIKSTNMKWNIKHLPRNVERFNVKSSVIYWGRKKVGL